MKHVHSAWSVAPRGLSLKRTHLGNTAVVPASELASLREWQDRANRLPPGNTLVVVPRDNPHLRQVGNQIRKAAQLRGKHVYIATTHRRS